jgi:chaperonin GroES
VLVRILKERKTTGGIFIPDTASENFILGEVSEISDGRFENGFLLEHKVKIGDVVLFHSQSGYPVILDDKEYQLVPEKEIMAIVKGGIEYA